MGKTLLAYARHVYIGALSLSQHRCLLFAISLLLSVLLAGLWKHCEFSHYFPFPAFMRSHIASFFQATHSVAGDGNVADFTLCDGFNAQLW